MSISEENKGKTSGTICPASASFGFLPPKARKDSGCLRAGPSPDQFTQKRFKSFFFSHRPQFSSRGPWIEIRLQSMAAVIMGLALPAVWSHTPGSWPYNEPVMENVTACALGKISALRTIFRNNAGSIKWRVRETTSAERARFRFMRRELKQ